MAICYPLSVCNWLPNERPRMRGYFMSKSVFGQHFWTHGVWRSKITSWKVTNIDSCYQQQKYRSMTNFWRYKLFLDIRKRFYRAMLCIARLWDCMSSVRPSVTFRYRDHIGWNSSKIISRPNSLRLMRSLTPTWSFWCKGTPPKLGWNMVGSGAHKTWRCKIGPRLLLRTNRKSHTRFQLTLTWMTLEDLERPKCPSRRNKILLPSPP